MEVLIIMIISGILCIANVISTNVFLYITMGSMIFFPICWGLYTRFGWFKFYYHDVLGWHEPDKSPKTYDGCSIHTKCRHCGKDIMQDSQGNWF